MIPGSRTHPVVTNQSMVLFNSATGVDGIVYSNTVNTPVVGPVFSLLKSTDKLHASLGDTLVYTLIAKNNGNTDAHLTIYDPLPVGITFIANSVLRDGVPLPGATPFSGIPLGSIAPQTQVNITFQVVIVALPPSLILHNIAQGRFSFTTPEGRIVNGEILSNSVTVSLLSYQLSTSLAASTPTSFVGDVVTYTLRLKNEGTQVLYHVIATIPVPNGAQFVPGSVIAAGVYYPESDPEQGILLGPLGMELTVEISFRVRIVEIPPSSDLTTRALVSYVTDEVSDKTESNTVVVTLVHPNVSISKKVDLSSAVPGDSLRYELIVTNSGNLAVNAVLMDTMPSGTLFVWDSVLINGNAFKGARPAEGIQLGTLRAGAAAVVEFRVTIPSAANIHELIAIRSQGSVHYTFLLPDGRTVKQTSRSNAVTTLIVTPIISLEINVQPTLVEAEELVKCSISLSNNGNWPVEISLIRLALQGTILDPNSIMINGVPKPQTSYVGSLPLGTLSPETTINILYFVKVNEDVLGGSILRGFITALYLFSLDERKYSGEAQSNSYTLTVDEISE